MPKLKTKKAAAKRFKVTGSGKILRRSNFARHILTKKSSKRKRHLAASKLVSKADKARVCEMLGL
ncbi:MAG: 50S ribosomal protein L35 [Acidobacteria bacterium]|nr:50S ribosomal protein L35 [Acidobacteriota bacterium]